MSKHDYTPEQALRRLVEKLTAADPELAAEVLAAVNAGKDVQESEPDGRKKSRFFRHTVPYSPEEALQIALEVLRAHFIDQPLFGNSCHDNMEAAALGEEGQRTAFSIPLTKLVRTQKTIEIELQTETEIIPTGTVLTHDQRETLPIRRVSALDIKQQQDNFDHLKELVDFTEN